jgi:hypothetical protein
MTKRRGRVEKKQLDSWMIEFSKKVVILCVALHTATFLYSTVVMWKFMDLTALPTIISESSEVLRTCVFGYMVKAGLENWQKIKNAAGNAENNETEEPKG